MPTNLEIFKDGIIKDLFKNLTKKGNEAFNNNSIFFYLVENKLRKYSESTIKNLWKHTLASELYEKKEYTIAESDIYRQYADITDETINDIYDIISAKNLEEYLSNKTQKKEQRIKEFYKRKNVKLDFDSDLISEIQKSQKITSQKLDKYIGEKDSVEIVDSKNKEGKDKKIPKTLKSIFNPEESNKNKNIKFNNIQKKLLEIFINNNFELSSKEVGNFAKDHKLIKQQLVNNINEIFYESYEDNLIESTEDKFKINSFQIELLKKLSINHWRIK